MPVVSGSAGLAGAPPADSSEVSSGAGAAAGASDGVSSEENLEEAQDQGAGSGEGGEGTGDSEGSEGTEGGEGGEEGTEEGEGTGEGEGEGETGEEGGEGTGEGTGEGEEGAEGEEEGERVPAKDAQLADLYKEHPELKQIFKEHPGLRPMFFKATQLNRVFRTVQDGERAKDWALQLASFDKLYYSDKIDDKRQFLQQLWENSLDENKQPTGHYEQIAEIITSDALTNLLKRVTSGPDWPARYGLTQAQAQSAVTWAGRLLGIESFGKGGPLPATGTKGGDGSLPENVRQALADIDRREAALTSGEKTRQQNELNQWADGLHNQFTEHMGLEVEKIFGQASGIKALAPRVVRSLKRDIIEEVTNEIHSDNFFEAQVEALTRSGNRSQQHTQQIMSELKSRVREVLPKVARSVLRDAGLTLQTIQKTKNTRQGEANSRREPVTRGAAPGRINKPSKPGTTQKPGESYDAYANRVLGIEK